MHLLNFDRLKTECQGVVNKAFIDGMHQAGRFLMHFWLPGSCCSTVHCCTWSPVSGCTCCSRSLPLWHTPDNTKTPPLEIPISRLSPAAHHTDASGTYHRAAAVALLSSFHKAISTHRRVQQLPGKEFDHLKQAETHTRLSLSVGCTFTGLLKRQAPPPLFRKLWNSSTLQSENFLGR